MALRAEERRDKLRKAAEMCIRDRSGPALELIKKYGLDAEGIYKKVKAFVK